MDGQHLIEFVSDRVLLCVAGQTCYQLHQECSGQISGLNTARTQAASSVARGSMYVLAGKDLESSSALDSVEKYDIKANKWIDAGFKMFKATNKACSVAINCSAIFVAGGHYNWKQAYILNLDTERWTKCQDSIRRIAGECEAYRLEGRNGIIAAATGPFAKSMQFYDLEQNKWEMLPKLGVGQEAKVKEVNDKLFVVAADTDVVQTYEDGEWKIVDPPIPETGNRARVTKVTEKFGRWLLGLSDVDWTHSCL